MGGMPNSKGDFMQKKVTDKQKKEVAQQSGNKRTKIEFEDDRTPAVKKIDAFCRFLATLLAIMSILSLHMIVRDGGYNSEKPVFVLGYSISNLEKDSMKPEIESGSVVFLQRSNYEEGDIVFYSSADGKDAGEIQKVEKNRSLYTIKGVNDSEAVLVESTAIVGKIIADSKALYKFFKIYLSAVGVAGSIIICFVLIAVPDILMFKKRRAAAQAKREAYAKKQARKLKVKQGMVNQDDLTMTPKETVQKKRQEKIDKDRAEIELEMEEIRKKMAAEEKELKSGGKK